jgi:hypothetical protein
VGGEEGEREEKEGDGRRQEGEIGRRGMRER